MSFIQDHHGGDQSWSVSAFSVYSPQCGLSDSVKDIFYDQLRAMTAKIPASESSSHVGIGMVM